MPSPSAEKAECVHIYTDGSALGNPGAGGYGVVLIAKEAVPHHFSAGYRWTTNNRMELWAVIAGLEALPQKDMEVHIYSDSQYVVHPVMKGWLKGWAAKGFLKKKNVDLWKKYLNLAEFHKIHLHWLRGHSGQAENECCDQLARAAAAEPDQIDSVYEQNSGKNLS